MTEGCSVKTISDYQKKEYLCDISQSPKVIDKDSNQLMINNLDNEGDNQFLANNYQSASECYKLAFDIRAQMLGNSHIDLTKSLYNLATIHEVREEYSEAETLYRKALNILKLQNQSQQSKVNEFLGYLVAIRYQKSSKSTAKSLQGISTAFNQIHDPRNIRVGAINHQLANHYLKRKNYLESEEAFKKSLLIIRQHTGTKHPYYAKLLQDYAKLLNLTERKKQSVKFEKQADLILNNYPKKLHTKLYQNGN